MGNEMVTYMRGDKGERVGEHNFLKYSSSTVIVYSESFYFVMCAAAAASPPLHVSTYVPL